MDTQLMILAGAVVVAFLIGRIGRKAKVLDYLVEKINDDKQEIDTILKYHCESLPTVANELITHYADEKPNHERDGIQLMDALAFHYFRLNCNFMELAWRSSNRAEPVGKVIEEWFPTVITTAEKEEDAFVRQIRSAVDPQFRLHLIEVNEKGFERSYKVLQLTERYEEFTAKGFKEDPMVRL